MTCRRWASAVTLFEGIDADDAAGFGEHSDDLPGGLGGLGAPIGGGFNEEAIFPRAAGQRATLNERQVDVKRVKRGQHMQERAGAIAHDQINQRAQLFGVGRQRRLFPGRGQGEKACHVDRAVLDIFLQDDQLVQARGGGGGDGRQRSAFGGARGCGGCAGFRNQFRLRQEAGEVGAALAQNLGMADNLANILQADAAPCHQMLRNRQGKAVEDFNAGMLGQLVKGLGDGAFAGVFDGHDGQWPGLLAWRDQSGEDVMMGPAGHPFGLGAKSAHGGFVGVGAFGAEI
jgi:hypothetical protein